MKCTRCKEQRLFLTRTNGRIMVCRSCGSRSDYSAPKYDEYHSQKYSYSRLRTPQNDPLLKSIINHLGTIHKNTKILDYGCGAGDYSVYLSQFSNKVVGVDLNTQFAEKRSTRVKWVNHKSKLLPFESNSFDIVLCVNLIEHLHDFETAMKEIRRVLKPGGKLFITTFDTEYLLHKIHYDSTHLYEWREKDFSDFVSSFFDVEENFSYGSYFNYYPFNWVLVRFLQPELCVVARKSNF